MVDVLHKRVLDFSKDDSAMNHVADISHGSRFSYDYDNQALLLEWSNVFYDNYIYFDNTKLTNGVVRVEFEVVNGLNYNNTQFYVFARHSGINDGDTEFLYSGFQHAVQLSYKNEYSPAVSGGGYHRTNGWSQNSNPSQTSTYMYPEDIRAYHPTDTMLLETKFLGRNIQPAFIKRGHSEANAIIRSNYSGEGHFVGLNNYYYSRDGIRVKKVEVVDYAKGYNFFVFGDSISDVSTTYIPYHEHWAFKLKRKLNGKPASVKSFAQSGAVTDNLISGLNSGYYQQFFDNSGDDNIKNVALLMIGINDYGWGHTERDMKTQYEEIKHGFESAGIDDVWFIAIPPCKPETRQDWINRVNSVGDAVFDGNYIDTYRYMLDKDTHVIRDEYTVDGTHPSAMGTDVIAGAVYDVISKKYDL